MLGDLCAPSLPKICMLPLFNPPVALKIALWCFSYINVFIWGIAVVPS